MSVFATTGGGRKMDRLVKRASEHLVVEQIEVHSELTPLSTEESNRDYIIKLY